MNIDSSKVANFNIPTKDGRIMLAGYVTQFSIDINDGLREPVVKVQLELTILPGMECTSEKLDSVEIVKLPIGRILS